MGKQKPSGIRSGRKLRMHRRDQRWADKGYVHSHSVTALKANPFGGTCMAKGIVLEKMCVSPPSRCRCALLNFCGEYERCWPSACRFPHSTHLLTHAVASCVQWH